MINMEALIYDRDMELGNDWQLFGGQLQDLPSVQSTFADRQPGQVFQNSLHEDEAGELLGQSSEADFLEDSAWSYSVDAIDSKHPSSIHRQEDSSLYQDVWCDILSSSPEEAFLPIDDDGALGNVASAVDSDLNFIVSSYDSGSHLSEPKFDYENVLSGQQYLVANVLQNFSENLKVQVKTSHDLIAVNKGIRLHSFASEHGNALDSFHYENHYKSAAELDGLESGYDSLLDAESVCNILEQLVAGNSGPHPGRPVLLSVSPEEVDSVLFSDSVPRVVDDYEPAAIVPSSSPVSDASFLQFPEVADSSLAVLNTEYSQDSFSSISSASHSPASSPYIPYSVEGKSDRRLKKKEQNKTAAARYRSKKREEKGVVYSEVEELEQKNAGLQARADDLTREINYLKSLLEEIKRQ